MLLPGLVSLRLEEQLSQLLNDMVVLLTQQQAVLHSYLGQQLTNAAVRPQH